MTTILYGDDAIKKRDILTRCYVGADGWEYLLFNAEKNEYWLLEYPNSEYHGGGSPRLTLVDEAFVKEKTKTFKKVVDVQ
jgi:hypothetical protein